MWYRDIKFFFVFSQSVRSDKCSFQVYYGIFKIFGTGNHDLQEMSRYMYMTRAVYRMNTLKTYILHEILHLYVYWSLYRTQNCTVDVVHDCTIFFTMCHKLWVTIHTYTIKTLWNLHLHLKNTQMDRNVMETGVTV